MGKIERARDLSAGEIRLLTKLLRDAPFNGAPELAAQVNEARVVGGITTLLDLEVPKSLPRGHIEDGPAPLRAFVEGPSGDVEGELIVWVQDGYLSGLEFAWFSDEVPTGMPSPDRVRIEPLDELS